MTDTRLGPFALLTCLLLLVSGCATARPAPAGGSPVSQWRGSAVEGLYRLPDTALTDDGGGRRRLRTGKPITLVFFGYTHCADVCTGILTDVAVALQRLSPEQRSRIDVLAITTDPARDTPPVLREYLRRIDPSFVGLTGSPAEVSAVATAAGVEFARGKTLPAGGYEVDHGAQLLAFGPAGQSLVVWTPGTSVGDLRHDLERLVAG